MQRLASELTDTATGAVIVGFWMSVIVTSCSQVSETLPASSVAVQRIIVVPTGKTLVNGNASERTPVKTNDVEQLSVAIGSVIATIAPQQ